MSLSREELDALMERKAKMRRQAYDARNAQENKDELSKIIVEKFVNLPEYAKAKTVMWYIDARSEVRTRHSLGDALNSDKRIIVPYCTVDEQGQNKLGLWHLESMDELVVGKWKILEPPKERWGEPGKEVEPEDLDLIMVPGVGFDRRGGRMGNGQGYYDRLLERGRPDSPLIALAFESQMFPEILVGPHDIFMDKVITEKAIYEGKGRS
ncbi:MAG TPA: 5-formyltetrahydrofolate cyclo-ligase [Gammaproteobacteria bacterium]|jgi:5-formyltetrahydrofolate cyclo-ligase|nr:5-formyltetrahydrofolate cyclo-ligase [Gammaproteobacteria bacterium]